MSRMLKCSGHFVFVFLLSGLFLVTDSGGASAFSAEKGDAVQGSYVNLADPDEQAPAYLKPAQEEFAPTYSSHFSSDADKHAMYPAEAARQNLGVAPQGQQAPTK